MKTLHKNIRSNTLAIVSIIIILTYQGLYARSPKNGTNWQPSMTSVGEGPVFFLDYTNLLGLDKKTYVEFYFQVGFEDLQFIKQAEGFQAAYDLEILIFDQANNKLESYAMTDAFEVDSYPETQSQEKARSLMVPFSFEPGEYRIVATVTDLETEKQSRVDEIFPVSGFLSQNLMLSDVQLSSKIRPLNSNDAYPGYYVKNQRFIEPNARRTFARGLTDIYLYFEIYNLEYSQKSDSTYTAYFVFYNHKGERIAQLHRCRRKPGVISTHSLRIPVDYFSEGKYRVQVSVRDDATGQTAETSKSFMVLDSQPDENKKIEDLWSGDVTSE